MKASNFSNTGLDGGRSFLTNTNVYLTNFFGSIVRLPSLFNYLNHALGSLTVHVSTLVSVAFGPYLLIFSMLSPTALFVNGSLLSSLFNIFTFNLTV